MTLERVQSKKIGMYEGGGRDLYCTLRWRVCEIFSKWRKYGCWLMSNWKLRLGRLRRGGLDVSGVCWKCNLGRRL